MEKVLEQSPNPHSSRMLTIRWEDGFEAALVQAVPDAELRTAICDSIELIIARRAALASAPIPGSSYYVYATEATKLGPSIRIFFRIEGEVVAFVYAERVS